MKDSNRFLVKFGLNAKIVVNKEFGSTYEDVKNHTKINDGFLKILL